MKVSIKRRSGSNIAVCTEIPLVVNSSDLNIPYFDTGQIQCNAEVYFSIKL